MWDVNLEVKWESPGENAPLGQHCFRWLRLDAPRVLLASGRILLRIAHLRKEWEKRLFIPAPTGWGLPIGYLTPCRFLLHMCGTEWAPMPATVCMLEERYCLGGSGQSPWGTVPRAVAALRGGQGGCGDRYQSEQHGLPVFSLEKNLDQIEQKLFTRKIILLEDGMLFLTANICISVLGIKTTNQNWRDHWVT